MKKSYPNRLEESINQFDTNAETNVNAKSQEDVNTNVNLKTKTDTSTKTETDAGSHSDSHSSNTLLSSQKSTMSTEEHTRITCSTTFEVKAAIDILSKKTKIQKKELINSLLEMALENYEPGILSDPLTVERADLEKRRALL